MRTLLFLTVFATTQALACPNLSGKYAECRDQNGQVTATNMIISQKVNQGVTTYTVTTTSAEDGQTLTEQHTADGKITIENQTDPETGWTFQMASTSTCEAKTTLSIAWTIKIDGELAADVITKAKKEAHRLVITSKGLSGDEQIDNIEICE